MIVTPRNFGNKLYDYPEETEYIITPLSSMRSSYTLGTSACRQRKLDNPYDVCGNNGDNLMPDICMQSVGKSDLLGFNQLSFNCN